MAGEPDPEYVRARRVLIDALEALAPHERALVLVGAQAIYLHTGPGHLAVAPYTTDGDLCVVPDQLRATPLLEEALRAGGFVLSERPGIWIRDEVELDLLVPEAVGGPGRRGARLGPHGNRAARKVKGLEGALVDSSPMELSGFADDGRVVSVRVAGPAVLLVSKLHKIADREGQPDRLGDKDALDVLRLLQGVSTTELAQSIRRHLTHETSRKVTEEALQLLYRLFGAADATGVNMVVRATEGLEEPETIRGSCVVLASELIEAIGGGLRTGRPTPTRRL
jgi:hypothetical protein